MNKFLQNPKAIHETVIRDIVEIIADGIKQHNDYGDFVTFGKSTRNKSFRSITKASSNLILTFPVLISDQADLESATMIMKSHERKCAAMMQMLFSALSVSTDSENVYEYLQKFHKNLDFDVDDMNVDNFVDSMDTIADRVDESVDLENRFFKEWAYSLIQEDMKNLDHHINTNLQSVGINEYKVFSKSGPGGTLKVLREDYSSSRHYGNYTDPHDQIRWDSVYQAELSRTGSDQQATRIADLAADSNFDPASMGDLGYIEDRITQHQQGSRNALNIANQARRERDTAIAGQRRLHGRLTRTQNALRAERGRNRGRGGTDEPHWAKVYSDRMSGMEKAHSMAANPFVKTDVPKANELLPTMMVIHFHSYASNEPVTAVIGIKAKLYPMPSQEIVNRLVIRNKDNHGFHNFLRAATREISFLKDFVFAVDKAKIDALSSSKKGSDSKIWKLLEKRAIKSRIRRSMGMNNDATAITSLVVTSEEVELLKKEHNVNIEKIPVIRPIMDAYNLMGVAIINQNLESVKFLYDDGSNNYETYSYRSLERETGDQNYKKVINLMTKMARQ